MALSTCVEDILECSIRLQTKERKIKVVILRSRGALLALEIARSLPLRRGLQASTGLHGADEFPLPDSVSDLRRCAAIDRLGRRLGAVWLATIFGAGCGNGQSLASVAPSPTPTVASTRPLSTIRVISPFSGPVIADRDQPVKITVVLTEAVPIDYTIEVSASPSFTPLAATVRMQLTPQQQASIPLPALAPDSWYIWRIRPTFREDGTFASSATFIIGPAAQ